MADKPVFTHLVTVDDIPARGLKVTLEAPQGVLPAIAKRLDVEGVTHLEAQIDVTRKGPLVFLEGRIQAQLQRVCVSSLENMEEEIDETFRIEFEQGAEENLTEEEVEIDADAPEPLPDETLDLADIAVQQVSLAMTPFPRKPGAEPVKDTAEQPSLSPFAALKDLKDD